MERFYFSWMANLGVLPLFLFLAFLFNPIFAFLLFRLVFVIRVKETIIYLRWKDYLCCGFVKWGTLLVNLIFSLTLSSNISSAQNFSSQEQQIGLTLGIGEQTEIKISSLQEYSVGNPQVIAAKYLKTKKILLIKGKKLGASDLVYWAMGGAKKLHIFVVSKREQLKLVPILNELKNSGLEVNQIGQMLQIRGLVSSAGQLKAMALAFEQIPDQLLSEVTFDKKILQKIISQIIVHFYSENLDIPHCMERFGHIECSLHHRQAPGPNFLKELQAKYPVKFQLSGQNSSRTNYFVKIKIIQFESLNGKEFSFGLDKIQGSIKDLFQDGPAKILQVNNLLFQSQNLKVSTLAEPEFLAQEGVPSNIEVGAQIAFPGAETDNGKSLHWKFAGLKFSTDLTSLGQKVQIKYLTELTRPGEQEISGNRGQSSLAIQLNRPTKIFSINFKSLSKIKSGLPFLSEIPILGHLFLSSNENDNYKKIEGYIEVSEEAE